METFKGALAAATWRSAEIPTANFDWKCEVGDIPYKMHDHYSLKHTSPTWRVIAMRMPVQDLTEKEREVKRMNYDRLSKLAKKNKLKEVGKPYQEGKWIVIGEYMYKFIITNDYTTSPELLAMEYNKRGYAERVISFMKNDFAWKLPPFMNMNENTVFMIAASLANNIFKGMLMTFKEFIPGLRTNARLREFQFVFIDVACAYIDKTYIFYNSDIDYDLLM